MKVILFILALCMILISSCSGAAGGITSWITGEVIALGVSAILAILGGAIGMTHSKIIRTFREFGEFLETLGAALEDNKISRDELMKIVKEGKDVFAVWRK